MSFDAAVKRPLARRPIIVAVAQTGISALVLSILCLRVDQRIGFTVVFALSVALSIVLARSYVFRTRARLRQGTAYALLQLGVYLLGLAITNEMVRAGLPHGAAGAVILVTGPLGFLSGWVVLAHEQTPPDAEDQLRSPWMRGIDDRHAFLHVVGVLTILELLVFRSYFTGASAPQWDFLASYQTEAFAWWNRGGLTNPPEWMSYAWMGFPADSNLQNSSYYLPVGLANSVALYTPHVAAVLAAINVAFCALGTYFLAKRMTSSHWAAMVALVAGFFSPGLFANAEHVDIARGIAWLPWLALVVSPLWWWRRWWSMPVAGVVVWQFLVGAYPGQIVAAMYTMPLWVVGWLIARYPTWRWLAGAILSATGGLLLSLAKFGPALTLDAGHVNTGPQSLVPLKAMAATVFFSYDDPLFTNSISMRSYFLVAPMIVLLGFARLRSRRNLPAVALGGAALLLTFATKWANGALASLPGFDLSRFRTTDLKPFLLLSLVLIGSAGAQRILTEVAPIRRVRLAWLLLVPAAAVALAFTITTDTVDRRVSVGLALVLLLASCVLAWAAIRTDSRDQRRGMIVGLVGVSTLSGLLFAYSVPQTWKADLRAQEPVRYGAPVASLIATPSCDSPTVRRQARFVPSVPPSQFALSTTSLAGAFNCAEAVGGYINVKGGVRQLQRDAFIADAKGTLLHFYQAPGAVVPLTGGTLADLSDSCLYGGACEGLKVGPISYSQKGAISYDLAASVAMPVALNESYYTGWEAKICTELGGCSQVSAAAGPAGSLMVGVPAGRSQLYLEYHHPGRMPWFLMSAVGVMILAGSPFIYLMLTRRRRRRVPRLRGGSNF